jgi:hypothetical protein
VLHKYKWQNAAEAKGALRLWRQVVNDYLTAYDEDMLYMQYAHEQACDCLHITK